MSVAVFDRARELWRRSFGEELTHDLALRRGKRILALGLAVALF